VVICLEAGFLIAVTFIIKEWAIPVGLMKGLSGLGIMKLFRSGKGSP
jgi:hypothetical protein